MPRPEKVRLGEILVQQKLLSEEQLNQALADQKRTGRKLGRVFVENGFVTEEQISGALARQLNIPYLNLKFYNINPEVVRLLPETAARRFRALVLEDRRETALVGVSDPSDLFAYDEISRLIKKGVELAVVNETEVLQAIDRIYRRTGEITGLAREVEQDLGDSYVDFGALAANPGLEEAPIVKLLQSVFDDAAQVRASDIHIEPQDRHAAVAAAQAHGGSRHLRKAPAAGRPLRGQGAQPAAGRAYLDHADPVRRVGRHASPEPGRRHLAARCDRHAAAPGRTLPRNRPAPERPGARDRPHRQRQDHHAL
jgi:hypothetical protein